MANQLIHLLREWYPRRDQTEWVLGTIYKTEGSCYRKASAMMLFNGLGQQFGLLSGGCLESDIQQQAKRVMQQGLAVTLCYDASDEDDLSFQLGIGCGGVVYILLQPVKKSNNYLELAGVYQALQQRQTGFYRQLIDVDAGEVVARFEPEKSALPKQSYGDFARKNISTLTRGENSHTDKNWLITKIQPEPHLLVIGGGMDARPLVNIASELGWETTLWDPRPANARPEYFANVGTILGCNSDELADYAEKRRVDAAVLMTHNVKLDADALKILQQVTTIHHMALLGPASRRKKVLKVARLSEAELMVGLSGPAGLDIGGELPESIALSIIAECHANFMKTQCIISGAEAAA